MQGCNTNKEQGSCSVTAKRQTESSGSLTPPPRPNASLDNIPSDMEEGFKLVRRKNTPQLSYAMNYKIHRTGRPLIPPAPRAIRPHRSSRERTRRPRLSGAVLTSFAAAGARAWKLRDGARRR